MKICFVFLTVVSAGRLCAGDLADEGKPVERPRLQVLSESVVWQPNGDSVTFQRVEPPEILPKVSDDAAKVEPSSTAEKGVRPQQQRGKSYVPLSISATMHADGLTALRWSCVGGEVLRAVSNVDFGHVAGLGTLETESVVYSVFIAFGTERTAAPAEEAAAAKGLPADGRPAFVLTGVGGKGDPVIAAQTLAAMDAVFVHFIKNQREFMRVFAEREAERAAAEEARRNAPPPEPVHAVIQFWPLAVPAQPDMTQPLGKGGMK